MGCRVLAILMLVIVGAGARAMQFSDQLFAKGVFAQGIAYPTVAHVAPALAPLEADDELFVKVNFKTLRNTLIGNFLDWCGVSMPCGTGEAGMPAGLLLSAPQGRDEPLLAVAMALEDIVAG